MALIKMMLLLPYYFYMNVMERVVKYVCKAMFLAIKIAEHVPVIGPKFSSILNRVI